MSTQALELIQHCLDTKDPYLDLGNCGLNDKEVAEGTDFHKLLGECTHLQTLILSNYWSEYDENGNWITKKSQNKSIGNKFDTHPPVLEKLVRLISLVCAGGFSDEWGIKSMLFVSHLTNLHYLNLASNQIQEIKGLENITTLRKLHLAHNQIQEIKGLDKLIDLQLLHLADNKIQEIKGLDKLIGLQLLHLADNKIREIKGLDNLITLQQLFLSGNKIQEIKGLDKLIVLQQLFLSDNEIQEIKGLNNLFVLQQLYLTKNQIQEIKGLDNLIALQVLYIVDNQIQELKGLDMLIALRLLHLAGNKIQEIKGLDNLIALQVLYLVGNKIQEIKGLGKLTGLQHLDLSQNQIQEIKGLDNLITLQVLYIVNNKIQEIKGLDNLITLQVLYLIGNKIQEIKGLEKLTDLQQLDLSQNQIKDISPLLSLLTREKNSLKTAIKDKRQKTIGELNVKGNPLTTPPLAIVEKGNEAVLRFFNEKLEFKFEAKILIVGEPEAGKTSLMKKLTDPTYLIPVEEDSTIGIQVIKWSCNHPKKPKPIQLNIWDFGGQEMQYLTHQFFLSSDALYILLTSARKDYDNLDYWFNIISLLGKNESNENSELMVVANEIKMKEGQVSKTFDEKKYRDLYPHLPFTFLSVNLSTDADTDGRFDTLQHFIKEKIVQLPILGKRLPIKWGIARTSLANLKVNYVPIQQYLKVCKKTGIDEKFALDLSSYLHKIGEVVHFKADDYVILSPKWAVDGMYSILKRKDIEESDGHFTQQQVYEIWESAGYTHPECNLLLSLMSKDSFEVAYKIPWKKGEYIAPQLLSLSQPNYHWDKKDALHFRYFYPFMPKGIITRLIVRMHESIKYENGKGLVWRTGVILEKNGCIAKVQETKIVETGQQVIAIEILGNRANRKLLLYDICSSIEGIHKDAFSKINFERQIPCNCEHCSKLDQPGFFDYSELIQYIKDEIEKIRCKLKPKNEINIQSLLQDIFDVDLTLLQHSFTYFAPKGTIIETIFGDPFDINKSEKGKKKIFISYSQKDKRLTLKNGTVINFKEELETHLKALSNLALAENWSDSDLMAGEGWDEKIKEQLADADIILFLVSANLIATKYVLEEEIPLAKYYNRKKHTVIIPVILNHCDWQSVPLFAESNVVPHKGNPVATYDNRDEAYNEIVNKIKEILEK
ncbi:MAG TPA: leucine-rich repeat protein [Chitinophagaceae bacterium]|nr:leucine-rich repeat protein [Chitinophagaceae bacterium]